MRRRAETGGEAETEVEAEAERLRANSQRGDMHA
jgi:hypothetical protein